MTFYDYGELAHVSTIFMDSSGTVQDPSVVKFQYYSRALGVTTTLTYGVDAALVKISTGNYYVDVNTRESAGQFDWYFYSTGTGQAADQGTFYVRPARTQVP